ncbi:6-phosphogluconate dehydrogenase [Desulfobaculum bizertense DSM 18034]|uniref:6-phosphogluconate dehydrogenase n=1 Tax=Desulfobaculum bizertense DSM 18034 TaxID=1121442 RepID=A0A1T4X027_9BACT|nr:6-phosphogluconate dehydrogenase [Desulfobaculum bizertense DSM 18034]
MQIGMVGLGKMGMNMARRLLQDGHEVVAYNRSPAQTDALAKEYGGAIAAHTLEELVEALEPPRLVWLMLPAGQIVEEHIVLFTNLLSRGDVLIDGGNSRFRDDIRRARQLKKHGLHYVDAGVSGGIWGLEIGYCTMVGGERDMFELLTPLLTSLAPENGFMYCGSHGAGHFVKMVHNGIEYGMMQAYAEGFALLDGSEYGKGLELSELAKLWNQGSVIRSWLLELTENALERDPHLINIAPYVEDSGEGRWTVEEAVRSAVPAPVLTLALMERFRSRQSNSFADRLLSALRNEFGGHAVRSAEDGAADD